MVDIDPVNSTWSEVIAVEINSFDSCTTRHGDVDKCGCDIIVGSTHIHRHRVLILNIAELEFSRENPGSRVLWRSGSLLCKVNTAEAQRRGLVIVGIFNGLIRAGNFVQVSIGIVMITDWFGRNRCGMYSALIIIG